jgi:hypothetical protein
VTMATASAASVSRRARASEMKTWSAGRANQLTSRPKRRLYTTSSLLLFVMCADKA